jgi:hypothetical protein
MTESGSNSAPNPEYEKRFDAPVVYFDLVAANGLMNGAIEIELAYRVLTPGAGTGCNGKIRYQRPTAVQPPCSPNFDRRAGKVH